jgi:hypothetical protein
MEDVIKGYCDQQVLKPDLKRRNWRDERFRSLFWVTSRTLSQYSASV